MTTWTQDGHPVQAGTDRADYSLTGQRAHYSILDVREMVVVARYYVDDPNNRSKRFIEYTCRDLHTSELYPGARQLSQMGGVDDGDDNVLRPATSLLPGATGVAGILANEMTAALGTDGDQVLVGFISGSRSRPVIVGVFRHSASQYGASSADGERRLTRHKGTVVTIESDGTWFVATKGSSIELDPDGTVTVESKSGAQIEISSDGKVTISCATLRTVDIGDGSDLTPDTGVVNGQAVDPFTGATQFALGNASITVRSKK